MAFGDSDLDVFFETGDTVTMSFGTSPTKILYGQESVPLTAPWENDDVLGRVVTGVVKFQDWNGCQINKSTVTINSQSYRVRDLRARRGISVPSQLADVVLQLVGS